MYHCIKGLGIHDCRSNLVGSICACCSARMCIPHNLALLNSNRHEHCRRGSPCDNVALEDVLASLLYPS